MFTRSVIVLLFLTLIFSSCNKDEGESDEWKTCSTCGFSDWSGTFLGRGSVYIASGNTTFKDQAVEIVFQEAGTNYLNAYVEVTTHVDEMISGTWYQPSSISFAGTAKALSATLYVNKLNELKLSGSYKVFTNALKDDDPEILKVVTFEVFKQ